MGRGDAGAGNRVKGRIKGGAAKERGGAAKETSI